jgi:hypothetical protein
VKSGCRAKESQLRTAKRVINVTSVFRVLNRTIFWLAMLNQVDPDAPPDLTLTQSEIDLIDKLAADKGERGSAIGTIPSLPDQDLPSFAAILPGLTMDRRSIKPFGEPCLV